MKSRIWQAKLFFLLCALLAIIAVLPFVKNPNVGGVSLQLLMTAVILATVFASGGGRKELTITLSLAVPWLAISWFALASSAIILQISGSILFMLLNAYTIYLILRHVFTVHNVTFNILSGAVSVYLLIGLMWAVGIAMLENIAPGSFANLRVNGEISFVDALYFSYTTITTLGYGDIAPIGRVARIITVLEAVTGTLYIAVLIASLVGKFRN